MCVCEYVSFSFSLCVDVAMIELHQDVAGQQNIYSVAVNILCGYVGM
jgi:hypothetical protein